MRLQQPAKWLDSKEDPKTVAVKRIRASCGQPPLRECLPLFGKEVKIDGLGDRFKEGIPNVCPDLVARVLSDFSLDSRCLPGFFPVCFPAKKKATIEDPKTVKHFTRHRLLPLKCVTWGWSASPFFSSLLPLFSTPPFSSLFLLFSVLFIRACF